MLSFLSRVGVGRGSVLKIVFGDVGDVFFELEHVEHAEMPMETSFTMREMVRVVGDAISHLRYREIATQASLLVFSPTICICCANFWGNFVPIVYFDMSSTYHIINKDTTLSEL